MNLPHQVEVLLDQGYPCSWCGAKAREPCIISDGSPLLDERGIELTHRSRHVKRLEEEKRRTP